MRGFRSRDFCVFLQCSCSLFPISSSQSTQRQTACRLQVTFLSLFQILKKKENCNVRLSLISSLNCLVWLVFFLKCPKASSLKSDKQTNLAGFFGFSLLSLFCLLAKKDIKTPQNYRRSPLPNKPLETFSSPPQRPTHTKQTKELKTDQPNISLSLSRNGLQSEAMEMPAAAAGVRKTPAARRRRSRSIRVIHCASIVCSWSTHQQTQWRVSIKQPGWFNHHFHQIFQ